MQWKLICGNPEVVRKVEEELNGAFLTKEGRIITASMLVAAELAGYIWDSELQEWMKDGDMDTVTLDIHPKE